MTADHQLLASTRPLPQRTKYIANATSLQSYSSRWHGLQYVSSVDVIPPHGITMNGLCGRHARVLSSQAHLFLELGFDLLLPCSYLPTCQALSAGAHPLAKVCKIMKWHQAANHITIVVCSLAQLWLCSLIPRVKVDLSIG